MNGLILLKNWYGYYYFHTSIKKKKIRTCPIEIILN